MRAKITCDARGVFDQGRARPALMASATWLVFGRLYAAGKPVNREWLDRESLWIVLTRIVTRKTVVLWLTVKVRDTQCLEANETKPNSIVL